MQIEYSLTLMQSPLRVYLEYNWGVGSYKSKRQALNTGLLFVLWNKVKEIWCTRKLFVSFHIKFHNCRNQFVLSWLWEFEHNCCVYWVVYLVLWILEGICLLNSGLLLIWCIGFGGIEPLVVDKILRRYIEIFGEEPLVVDKILRRCFRIGGVEPLVVDILRFFGVIDKVIWGEVSTIEAATAWNRGIPCKNWKITHNYLIFLFYYHLLVHFLIILWSTELIFGYIEVLL